VDSRLHVLVAVCRALERKPRDFVHAARHME